MIANPRPKPNDALVAMWAADAARGLDPFEIRSAVELPPADLVADAGALEQPHAARKRGRLRGLLARPR